MEVVNVRFRDAVQLGGKSYTSLNSSDRFKMNYNTEKNGSIRIVDAESPDLMIIIPESAIASVRVKGFYNESIDIQPAKNVGKKSKE